VRYLPSDAEVGTGDLHLTIGTYKVANAYSAALRAVSKPGTVRINVPTSAIAFSTTSHPLNAWVTYPGSSYQIEVFDRRPDVPVGWSRRAKWCAYPELEGERPVVVSPKRASRRSRRPPSDRSTGPALSRIRSTN
jgi:hypothetical protein